MKSGNSEIWKEVKDAFGRALELGSLARAAFLSSLPEAVQIEVRSLLEHSEDDGADFLETPASEISPLFDFKPGEQVLDFEILEKLGEGSFGTVFRAKQLSLGREVALKITPNIGTEAQVMAHLEHENIVSVYSEVVEPNRQLRMICMQLVTGGTLKERFSNFASEPQIIELGIKLSRALQHAHEKGVLHLDIKPGNILINEGGSPLLTDFNISLSRNETTGTALYGGSKDYMAPEQETLLKDKSGNGSLNETADIYSTGKVLEAAIIESGLNKESLSENLLRVLDMCTQLDRTKRIHSTQELAELLEGCKENLEIATKLQKNDFYGRLATKCPTFLLIISIFLPHALASAINIAYNAMRIVSNLSPLQQSIFNHLLFIVNPILYTVCLVLLFIILKPVMNASNESMKKMRRRALKAPLIVAWFSVTAWSIGALVFPLGIHFGSAPLTPTIFGHFYISFFLSALIGTTYSSLNALYFFVRTAYPRFWIGEKHIRDQATTELGKFRNRLQLIYIISMIVPLLGATLMVIVGPETLEGPSYAIYRGLLTAFLGMGIVGIFYSMRSSRDLSNTLSNLMS